MFFFVISSMKVNWTSSLDKTSNEGQGDVNGRFLLFYYDMSLWLFYMNGKITDGLIDNENNSLIHRSTAGASALTPQPDI